MNTKRVIILIPTILSLDIAQFSLTAPVPFCLGVHAVQNYDH